MIGEPVALAADAFVVPGFWRPPGADLGLQVSSLVLCGSEPVLVDTSLGADGDEWLDTVCSLVDPDEVRWVIVTGAGPAHTGGLERLRDACVSAEVVGPPGTDATELAEGACVRAGPRVLDLVPAPGGHAVHDRSSGILWADALAMPIPAAGTELARLDDAFVLDALATVAGGEWAGLIDHLHPKVVAGPRSPIARGPGVARAVRLLRSAGRAETDGDERPGAATIAHLERALMSSRRAG